MSNPPLRQEDGCALAGSRRQAGARYRAHRTGGAAGSAGMRYIKVTSAAEMLAASLSEVADADLFITAAAVADYRSRTVAGRRSKSGDTLGLELDLGRISSPRWRPSRNALSGGPEFATLGQRKPRQCAFILLHRTLTVIANGVVRCGDRFGSDDYPRCC
ncbi:MAG: hypothetical protein IPK48_08440 [Gammaproteobacteria bacterium]|nr:hypothetical protein [Gammaproteobacteria bacterium]